MILTLQFSEERSCCWPVTNSVRVFPNGGLRGGPGRPARRPRRQRRTHALLFDSPARDAGGASCLPTDQRGVTRPQETACDIGAYEWTGRIFQDGFESS